MPAAREGRDLRLELGELERLSEASLELGFVQLASVIEFAVATAMRRGEILTLKWCDVRHNSVLVRWSQTRPAALRGSIAGGEARARARAPAHP
jgi:integrase